MSSQRSQCLTIIQNQETRELRVAFCGCGNLIAESCPITEPGNCQHFDIFLQKTKAPKTIQEESQWQSQPDIPQGIIVKEESISVPIAVTHFLPKGDEGFSPSPQRTTPRDAQYSPRMPFEGFSPLFGLKPSLLHHYFQNSPERVSGLNPSI